MRIILFTLLIFSVSCSNVPFTGRKQLVAIPTSQMMSLSAESYDQVLQENKISGNQNYKNMVESVGRKMTVAVEE